MSDQPRDTMAVEFLYLDLEACARCRDTQAVLHEAIEITRSSLAALGIDLSLRPAHVASLETATRAGLVASPTVRIDGRDVQPQVLQGRCAECGDLCGCSDGIDCRLWAWRGETSPVPPVGLLVKALIGAAVRRSADAAPETADGALAGTAPDNLQRFFDSKERAPASACCAPGCCA